MPIRTRVPLSGKATFKRTSHGLEVDGDGDIVAPPSLTDFFEVYGTPAACGDIRQLTDYSEEGGDLIAYSTFEAVDPDEQSEVDSWAALIAVDDEQTIRGKITPRSDLPTEEQDSA